MQKITPFLWFDDQAEEAVNFYTALFKNSKIHRIFRYNEEAAEKTGRPVGSVLTIEFEIEGQKFVALNGGPLFEFNEFCSGRLELLAEAVQDCVTAKGVEDEDIFADAADHLFVLVIVAGKFAVISQACCGFAHDEEGEIARWHPRRFSSGRGRNARGGLTTK